MSRERTLSHFWAEEAGQIICDLICDFASLLHILAQHPSPTFSWLPVFCSSAPIRLYVTDAVVLLPLPYCCLASPRFLFDCDGFHDGVNELIIIDSVLQLDGLAFPLLGPKLLSVASQLDAFRAFLVELIRASMCIYVKGNKEGNDLLDRAS